MKINVTFISEWEEGEIEASAVLDLETGAVSEIEELYDIDEMETLLGERVKRGGVIADVEKNEDGEYFVIDYDDLDLFRKYGKRS